jgi:hypothetical protein
MICLIQFQTFLVILDPPDGIFQSKVEKQWWQAFSLFQAILSKKLVKQIFAYMYVSFNSIF